MPTYQPSSREIDVMRAIAKFGTLKEAARALNLSRHTIDWHLDNLRHETGLRFLPQIMAWAGATGYVPQKFL